MRGDDGLDVIAFGAREYWPTGELPRGRSVWSITGYIEIQDGHPWDREPELDWPEPEPERPPTIVNVSDVEPDVRGGRRRRGSRRAAGSRWTGLRAHRDATPGRSPARRTCTPPRRRSSSSSTARARSSSTPTQLVETDARGARRDPSSRVRPAPESRTRFAPASRGMTLIAWGTREPNDICWYPRSKKIFWRGVGVVGRIEQLDYWDGEELE